MAKAVYLISAVGGFVHVFSVVQLKETVCAVVKHMPPIAVEVPQSFFPQIILEQCFHQMVNHIRRGHADN